jgi:hypothetical protein
VQWRVHLSSPATVTTARVSRSCRLVISLSLGVERSMSMILGFGGGRRGGQWIVDDTCRNLQFPEYCGDFRGSMCVVEGRDFDQSKLGGWVYQMIKLSKARRSLVRR